MQLGYTQNQVTRNLEIFFLFARSLVYGRCVPRCQLNPLLVDAMVYPLNVTNWSFVTFDFTIPRVTDAPVKAKFHYASWFGAGYEHVRSQLQTS